MKEKPEISVVMPCYNEQDNIEISIQCILDQTFENFELIIVDDCSTDKSAEIINAIAKRDERVIYLKNAANLGVARSINNGLSIARGKYIARMDADDTCERTRFQQQVEYLNSHETCVLCGTYADVFRGKDTVLRGSATGDLKKQLVRNNPFVHSSVMFRRIVNGEVISYPETQGFEDYGLWIDLSDKGDFYIIPKVLVHRVDINNLETKKTWEGFTKLEVYKELRRYQVAATKKTGYWGYGIISISVTVLKIIYVKVTNFLKG